MSGKNGHLAALGPKMLRLSAERSLGAHTYFVPVGHTRAARQSLGESVEVEGIPRSEWTALASAVGTGSLHGT